MTTRREGFERHTREQLARWVALTPEERLRWLERAKRFVREANAGREASERPKR